MSRTLADTVAAFSLRAKDGIDLHGAGALKSTYLRTSDARQSEGKNSARLIIRALLLALLFETLAAWVFSFPTHILESIDYSALFKFMVISIEIICAATFLIPGFPIWEAFWLAWTTSLGLFMQVDGHPDMAGCAVVLVGLNVTAFRLVFPIAKRSGAPMVMA